jgi:hypothetical protein
MGWYEQIKTLSSVMPGPFSATAGVAIAASAAMAVPYIIGLTNCFMFSSQVERNLRDTPLCPIDGQNQAIPK